MSTRSGSRSLASVAFAIAAALGAATAAAAPLPTFEAHYTIEARGFKAATMEVSLRNTGDGTFVYESDTRAAGVVSLFRDDRIYEKSVWRLAQDHIQPLRYVYHHTGTDDERHARLRFDWHNQVVTNTVAEHSWRMDIPRRTLDKLAIHLAVMMDMARGHSEMVYPIADGGKLKLYRFETRGRETIDTPAGRFETVKVQRIRQDDDKTTYMWCAPELSYLPVQVEHRKADEGTARMVLQQVEM